MKKHEVLEYLKAMSDIGFVTHSVLLEIYNDEEEIPQETIDLICYKRNLSPPILIYTNEEGLKRWNEILNKKKENGST